MRRALVWLNLCGREAVRHKLINCQKTQKMHFQPVLELMSVSLTAIQVEPHQCPSHQSILLTQGPICKICDFFCLLHSHKNQSKFIWQKGWVEILMFCLVSRKFLAMRNITLYRVLGGSNSTYLCWQCPFIINKRVGFCYLL